MLGRVTYYSFQVMNRLNRSRFISRTKGPHYHRYLIIIVTEPAKFRQVLFYRTSGFPALWVEINAYESQGNPVAYLTALMRGDRCRTYIDLVLDKES